MKINWGWSIAIFYSLFVIVMVFMVMKSTQNKPKMVQENYYEKDLNYEAFRQKRQNGAALKDLVNISYEARDRQLKISFPGNLENIEGDITMYRPSNQYLDKNFKLDLDSMGDMIIPLDKSLAPGKWKIQLDWKNESQEFFNEEIIII